MIPYRRPDSVMLRINPTTPAFAAAYARLPRQTEHPGRGRHHDTPEPLLDQVWPRRAGHVERSDQVDVERVPQRRQIGIGKITPPDDSCIVHDDVDPAERIERCLDDRRRTRLRRHIVGVADSQTARGDDLVGHSSRRTYVGADTLLRSAEVVHHDARTSRPEQSGVRPSDSPAGTRDHCDSTVETQLAHDVRSSRLSTLPEGFRGSASMNVMSLGTLNFASWPRQCSISSSASGRRTGLEHDDGNGHLAPSLVRSPDHGGLRDGFVLVQHALDLGAGDVLAARHDHVLQPIDDVQIAVLVLHPDVAGVEPAATKGVGGRFRIAPVPLEHLRPSQHDLAALAHRDRRTLVVPDVELEIETCPPDAAELRRHVRPVEERVARDRFGEAVRVREPRRGESALQSLDERDRELLAPGDDHPHRRQIARLDARFVEHRTDHRRRHPDSGHLRSFDLVDHHRRIERHGG